MKNESINKTIEFINELENLESLTEVQIMDYAQWAGRLSALEEGQYLNRFFERFDNQTVNAALKKRIREGLEDIKEAYGEYLAVEIFTVQDFCCFVNHAPKDVIDSDAKELMDFWIFTAESQSLDDEAAQTLEAFLDSYPVDENDRLDIVAAPVTDKQMSYWANALEPMDEIIEQKSKALENRIKIEKIDNVPDSNRISIRISGVEPNDVVKVRHLYVPAIRSKTDASVWTFDFETFGAQFNEQENIVVETYDGVQAAVPCKWNQTKQIQASASGTEKSSHYVTLFISPSMTMAAAEIKPADYIAYVVEGTNALLSFAIDDQSGQILVNVYQKDNDEQRSNELDGWSFFDKNNSLLGCIENGFVKFKRSCFDGALELKDVDGKVRKLIRQ